jgi:hypothetical protein
VSPRVIGPIGGTAMSAAAVNIGGWWAVLLVFGAMCFVAAVGGLVVEQLR